MKLYDLIKTILQDEPEMRDSDKKLIWRVWETQHVLRFDQFGKKLLSYDKFLDAESTETIRRTRQKIQEQYPELRSSEKIQSFKDQKRNTWGDFVYKLKVKVPMEVKEYGQEKTETGQNYLL